PAGTVINTTPVMPAAEESAPNSAEPRKAPDEKPADAPAPVPSPEAASTEADAQKAAEQAEEIAKTKELLQQLQSELDLLKRQLALDSDTFYSKPDYAHDSNGKSQLDDLQKTIYDKLSSIESVKERLEVLIEDAGVSPEAEKATAPTER